MNRLVLLLVAVLLVATSAGVASATGPSVTVVGSLVTVRPQDSPGGSSSAAITAARNEFESFQVVVGAASTDLGGVSVGVQNPLTGSGGTIPASNITVYREAYYDVVHTSDLEGATGLWPDALIPSVDPFYGEARNAFPMDVPANENRVAWVDVLVPQNQTPGTYDGSLLVSGGGLNVTVPVHLTVLAASLPSTSSLRSAFGIDWTVCPAHFGNDCIQNQELGWAMKSLYVRAALEDRVTLDYSEYQPPTNYEKAWFQQYALPMLQGSSPQNDTGDWTPVRLPGARLTSIRVDGGSYLDDWRARAKEGGFGRLAFLYACDEPNRSASAWRGCKRRARDGLAGWPGLRILITSTLNNADRFDATSLIDLLVPIVNEMDDKPGASKYSGDQRPGYDGFLAASMRNEVWLYTSCESHGCAGDPGTDPYLAGWPSYAIDQPASEARAMGWLCYEYRISGELYFATDDLLTTAWSDQWAFGGNGDGTLFYPGKPSIIGGTHDIPIDSIRMKRIRDGREDYEYLKLAEAAGNGVVAMSIARGLFPSMYQADVTQANLDAARNQLSALM